MQPFSQNFNSFNYNISTELQNNNNSSYNSSLNFYKQRKVYLDRKINKLKIIFHQQYLKTPPCDDETQKKIVKLKKIFYKKYEAHNFNYDEVYLKKEDIEQINETLYLIKSTVFHLNNLFEKITSLCLSLENMLSSASEHEFYIKEIIEELEDKIIAVEGRLRELTEHIKALQSLANVADLFPNFETKKSNNSTMEERIVDFLDLVQDMDLSKLKK